MNFGLKLKAGALMETLNLSLSRVEDLAPPLKQFSKEKRAEIKTIFETQGDGQWPALAPSTVRKREHVGSARITEKGSARAGYLKKLQAKETRQAARVAGIQKAHKKKSFLGALGITHAKVGRKLAGAQQRLQETRRKLDEQVAKQTAKFSQGKQLRKERRALRLKLLAAQKKLQAPRASEAAVHRGPRRRAQEPDSAHLRAEVDRIKKQLVRLEPKIAKAAKADAQRGGKARPRKRRILGRIGQSIHAEVKIDGKAGGSLVIKDKLKKPILGKVHNDGGPAGKGAEMPMRKHLELTPKNIARFKEIIISHGLAPLQGRI